MAKKLVAQLRGVTLPQVPGPGTVRVQYDSLTHLNLTVKYFVPVHELYEYELYGYSTWYLVRTGNSLIKLLEAPGTCTLRT